MLSEQYRSADNLSGFAVWQITETEDELRSLLSGSADLPQLLKVRNISRRMEKMAVRILLAQMLGEGHLIGHEATGRPFLTDGSWFISISHTTGWAALAWHRNRSVGIDIEQRSGRVLRAASRFISPRERAAAAVLGPLPSPDYELLIWSAKETAYKWLCRTDVNFLDDMQVVPDGPVSASGTCELYVNALPDSLHPLEKVPPKIHYHFRPDYVLTFLTDNRDEADG